MWIKENVSVDEAIFGVSGVLRSIRRRREMAAAAVTCVALPSKFRNLSLKSSSSSNSSSFGFLSFSSNLSASAFSYASPAMAGLANLPKVPQLQKTRKRGKIIGFIGKQTENSHQHRPLTRRLAMTTSLLSIALFENSSLEIASAKENKYWIDGPLPLPSVFNDITNKKTGTRSFLKMGLYIANIGTEGRRYRLKKNAFDLLAMADLIGKDTLNYVRRYLRLKSTFMYYDFDKVISAAADGDKQSLTDLANRLFDNFEKLEDAAKQKNLSKTESCYQETSPILQEVMDRMA